MPQPCRPSSRRFVLPLLLSLVCLVACDAPIGDSFDRLPQSINGETLLYNKDHEVQAWAEDVLASTGRTAADYTHATGFTSPGPREYQSSIVQIKGVEGQALLMPFIESTMAIANVRTEVIDGKLVTRFGSEGGGGPDAVGDLYGYAFGDLAIIILARRPEEAREALRAMP